MLLVLLCKLPGEFVSTEKKCFNSRDRLYGENEHIYLRRLSGGMCFVPKNIAEDASVDW